MVKRLEKRVTLTDDVLEETKKGEHIESLEEREEKISERAARKAEELYTDSKANAGKYEVKREEYDIRLRKDRIGKYLQRYVANFVFDEFSEAYLSRSKKDLSFMIGVPVPLRKRDLAEFKGGSGLDLRHICENMAWIIGIDPNFKHANDYCKFMDTCFGFKVAEGLLKEGRDAAEEGSYDDACIHFRAALCLRPDFMDAMYSYARVCRAMYLESNNTKYVKNMKEEANEFFELITMLHPRFAQPYYFLGYAYINQGQYLKAKMMWDTFLKKTLNGKAKKEIKERLKQIEDPVKIEEGYTAVIEGKWKKGIDILSRYKKSRFKDWWPLSYYLGIAYIKTGMEPEGLNNLHHVLTLNASHVETMDELASVYSKRGDKANFEKYSKKAELIRKGGHGGDR